MIHGIDTSFLIAVEIEEHPQHADARRVLAQLVSHGDKVALVPQVLAEFVHVISDPRRFQRPCLMSVALQHSERWWSAKEVEQVTAGNDAVLLFHEWMRRHQLGRKRVLDTLLAATYRAVDINSLLTLNFGDFEVFGGFSCVEVSGNLGKV